MPDRKIGVTLECFIKKDGKYLMLHRSSDKRIMPGVWMAPGGHREPCEGLFECARREIFEETGLKIKNLKIKATGVAYLQDIKQEIYFHFLTADYAGGELKQNPEDGELVWLTAVEILKLDNLLAELKKVLIHVFSNSDDIISYKAVYDRGNNMTEFVLENSN